MAENKNELAEKKKPNFSMALTEGLMENKDALPANFNVARFVQNSVALINGNEPLQKFVKQYGLAPLKMGLSRGAFLDLDALNSEFHLIPFGSQLQFIVDYRGAVKLMKKYSIKEVEDIYAEVVRQGDVYERKIVGGKQTFDFFPKPFNTGKVIGAFGVCLYKDGTMIIEELSLEELEKIRSKSKAKNGMAWQDFTNEMYKKSCLHRLKKRVPLNFDNPVQKEIFDEDGAIELAKSKSDVPDIDEVPDVVVESKVIEDEYDMPDFMKGE